MFFGEEGSDVPEIFGDASQPSVIKIRNLQSCLSDTNVGTTPF